MSRKVQVQSGVKHVEIDGEEYNAGDQVVVSNGTFAALTSAGRFTDGTLTDLGDSPDVTDDVSVQGAHQAAPAALTSSAPAALTATVAATNPPTKVEFDKVVADAVALRTTLAATQADVAALRTSVAALVTALTGTDKSLAAS